MDTTNACPLHARLAAAVLAACPPRAPRRFLRPADPPALTHGAPTAPFMEANKAVLALGSIATTGARFGRPTVVVPPEGGTQDPALLFIEACSQHGKDHALRPAALRTQRGGVLLVFDDESALIGRVVPATKSAHLVLWPAACRLHGRANGKAHEAAWRFEGLAGRVNAVDPRLRVYALGRADEATVKADVAYAHSWRLAPHPNAAVQKGLEHLRAIVDTVLAHLPVEAGPFAMPDGHTRLAGPIPTDVAQWMGRPAWAGQANVWPAWLPHRHVPEEAWLVDSKDVRDVLSWIALAAPKEASSLLLAPLKRAHLPHHPQHPYAYPYGLLPQAGAGAHQLPHAWGKTSLLLDVLHTFPPKAHTVMERVVMQATGLRFAPSTKNAVLPEPRLLDPMDLGRMRVSTSISAHQRLALVGRYGPPPTHLWAHPTP